ncbi:hypothetical protein [Spiroplasma sp. SV19]|uniref:relaxase/mobilization nuclease domain-containing protein n=1 Tax=Spiroplasma sp. SV19 TaxID=2570468 RepID=UPI0024B6C278|nr:hypothetical protein [Spiroplasma sp. SV19]WHQ37052.1 hypothetical protein E7Y35_04035 [Spiroplasma sp. SV19]
MNLDKHSGYEHTDQAVPVIWKIIRFSKNSEKFQSKRKYYKSGDYWKYITRPEALCKCCLNNDKLKDLKTTDSLKDYSKQINEITKNADKKDTGIYANGNKLTSTEANEMSSKIKNLEENQLLWDCVLSFSNDFEKEYNLHNREQIAEVIDSNIKKYFRKAGLDTNNLDYWFVVHDNTENIHAHIGFMEKEPKSLVKGKSEFKYRELGKIAEEANEYFRFQTQQYVENRREFFKELRTKRDEITPKFRMQVHNDIKNNSDELTTLIKTYLTDAPVHKNGKHFKYAELYQTAPEKQLQLRNIVDYAIQNNDDLKFQVDDYLIRLQTHRDQLIKDNENNKTAVDKANKWYWKEIYGDGLYRRLANAFLNTLYFKPKHAKKPKYPPGLYEGINKPFDWKYNSLSKLTYELSQQFGLAMQNAMNNFRQLQNEIHNVNSYDMKAKGE